MGIISSTRKNTKDITKYIENKPLFFCLVLGLV